MSQAGSLTGSGGGGGTLNTLTANSGGAVSPTGVNINVVGDGTTIDIVGNPGTSTLTVSSLVGAQVCAFNSYITIGGVFGVTGDGTTYQIIFDNEYFDIGGDYDTATGVFTAPSAGYYAFNVTAGMSGMGVASTDGILVLKTSNQANGLNSAGDPLAMSGKTNTGQTTWTVSFVAYMDAADTAFTELLVWGVAKTVDLFSNGPTNPNSWFSGYKIG